MGSGPPAVQLSILSGCQVLALSPRLTDRQGNCSWERELCLNRRDQGAVLNEAGSRDWYPPAASQIPCTKRHRPSPRRRTARGLSGRRQREGTSPLLCPYASPCSSRGDSIAVWTPQWATHSSGLAPTFRAWSKTVMPPAAPYAPSFPPGPEHHLCLVSSGRDLDSPGFLPSPWNPLSRPR